MKKKNLITATLVAASMTLTAAGLRAGNTDPQDPATGTSANNGQQGSQYQAGQNEHHGKYQANAVNSLFKASYIIGKTVQSDSGEKLGKVQDIIVNLSSDRAPFLIVSSGGALGIGATRVAVPFREVRWLPDTTALALNASKDKFEAAPTMPTAGWAAVAGEDWAKNIDRFYGEPGRSMASRFERQPMGETKEGAEPVRTPSELNSPMHLQHSVDKIIKQDAGPSGAANVHSSIQGGTVTLSGNVSSQEEKQRIEDHLKALPGVERVDNQLTVKE